MTTTEKNHSEERAAQQSSKRRQHGRWHEVVIHDTNNVPSWKHSWEKGFATAKVMAIGSNADDLPVIQINVTETHLKHDGKIGASKGTFVTLYGDAARAIYETLREAFEGDSA